MGLKDAHSEEQEVAHAVAAEVEVGGPHAHAHTG
jgi:hypothetical protein